ncbi:MULTISPECIES: efflux RND transporter periplasmic adaptor subunit [unclassified Shinella]|jgi:gold/copper resistance efflux system membrane fusion protein|uniref:efflux RND transporter periplasmic adaptor subunit n=1 Tax=unclassified Shinella TaxID=2643062 RepID=UPI00234F9058|nr:MULTISPECIES: efflux RND transporter periplasmic adaptor subunit [unclassified Shinella]MCO5148642.1 efflux RND transporter periplasmic adaptor subunit [Shinella sp.]MDC7264704.1 efflux RND transporter periplasmic adaptor subunit [Shinella sp. HY16]MDC7271601.1 efflux RND transporter periplasmic adaptor subunit [Shinella sp. YZ44]
MSNKASSTLLLAGVAIAAGTLAFVYRDDVGPYAGNLMALALSTGASEAAALPVEMPLPQVPVAEVITRKVAPSAEFTGYLEAAEIVELRPRVGGAIDVVTVPEGRLVRPGELLFQIDPRPFTVTLNSARAQLQQAGALLDQAEVDFKRAEALAPKGTVPRKMLDDAQAIRRQRAAEVEIARAAVAAAELDLSFTRVTAPVAGRVDRVLVTQGNLVAGGNAAAATLLTTIVSTDLLHVYFDIDEATYLGFVAQARSSGTGTLPVQVGLMTDTGFPYAGELDFLGNRVDRGTGTIRARAILKDPDRHLTPGLFARVRLVTAEPAQTVLVDDQAIGVDQGRRYVLVLGAGDKVEYRPIESGPMIAGLRVVSAGLDPAERIIVKGLVRPGMQVVPQMVSMLPGQSADDKRAETALQEAGQ